jgi:hypothetical protein
VRCQQSKKQKPASAGFLLGVYNFSGLEVYKRIYKVVAFSGGSGNKHASNTCRSLSLAKFITKSHAMGSSSRKSV